MSAASQSDKSGLITNQTQLAQFRNEFLKINTEKSKEQSKKPSIPKHSITEEFKESFSYNTIDYIQRWNQTKVLTWIRSMPPSKLSETAKHHITQGMIGYGVTGEDLIDAKCDDLADALDINFDEARKLFYIIKDRLKQERLMQCRRTKVVKDIMDIERKLTSVTAKKQISKQCQHSGCNIKAPEHFPNDIYICEKHSKALAVQLKKASFECKHGTNEEKRICQKLQVSYDTFVSELQNPSTENAVQKHVYPKNYFSNSMSKLVEMHRYQQTSNDPKAKKMVEQLMDILIVFRQKMNPWYVTFGKWLMEMVNAAGTALGTAVDAAIKCETLMIVLAGAVVVVSAYFIAKYALGYDDKAVAGITGFAIMGAGIGAFGGPFGAAAGGVIGSGFGLVGKGLGWW